MSSAGITIDVRDLAKESLSAGTFPVRPQSDFRLYMKPEVHRGIWEHAKKDLSIEICGVLVGHWERDEDGPFAVASNYIRCENASSKFAEVTFTHESWAQINREMDTKFENERIIGWYHSHPDFGIFLSDRDCFIQEHFFSGPGQVAYVVDPVRDLEGVFAWRAGKPTPLGHYWVGNEIRTVAASQQSTGPSGMLERRSVGQTHAAEEALALPASTSRQSPLDLATMLLSWIALFLLGYLLAGLQSRWEKEMIVEGTVAHYGYHKVLKLGLEDELEKVRSQLLNIAVAADKLPSPNAELSDDEVQATEKQRALIANNLMACEQFLEAVQTKFGLSDNERQVALALYMQKQAELQQMKKALDSAAKKAVEAKAMTAPPEKPAVAPAGNSPASTPAAGGIDAPAPVESKPKETDAASSTTTNTAPR
jgi:proteasome lid subunit RPN8/RPN11